MVRVYDPALRDCLACASYRDPDAKRCPCGRELRLLARPQPRPPGPVATAHLAGWQITLLLVWAVVTIARLVTALN